MLERIAVVTDLLGYAEVDPEAGAKALDAGLDVMAREERLQSAIQPVSHGMDVIVEPWLPVGSDGGQSGSDRNGMAVVGAAVLAIAARHEAVDDVTPAAEDAQRK